MGEGWSGSKMGGGGVSETVTPTKMGEKIQPF